ncbi:14123_t:CDS:2 [Cetraspora pellucida]|uniref:14123_t:CDS:1 n=1 Tax=Cetraspora pellucida TaxID=1433469 RepID=A0ACA9LCB3_9GLOM|nr:14123_t:CDS:2 [Cetraspora pellucida]
MKDKIYHNLVKYLSRLEILREYSTEQEKKLKAQARYYLVREETLYRKNKRNPEQPLRVLRKDQVKLVLEAMHEHLVSGHFGERATIEKVRGKYYWNQIVTDVREFVRSCKACQLRGKPSFREALNSMKITQPFDRVGLDVVRPLPLTKKGNRYLVVAVEYLLKWPEVRALPDCSAESVAAFLLEDIVTRHGCPREILSDQGSHFCNKVIDLVCPKAGIKHKLSSTYHSQTNRLVERFNRTICEALAKCGGNLTNRNVSEDVPCRSRGQ